MQTACCERGQILLQKSKCSLCLLLSELLFGHLKSKIRKVFVGARPSAMREQQLSCRGKIHPLPYSAQDHASKCLSCLSFLQTKEFLSCLIPKWCLGQWMERVKHIFLISMQFLVNPRDAAAIGAYHNMLISIRSEYAIAIRVSIADF